MLLPVLRRAVPLLLFCLAGAGAACALGKTEEAPKEPLNKEWIFCVTAFDTSALSPSRQVIGEVLAANLVEAFRKVERRVRVSPEYAYYEGAALARSRSEAAKKLAAKRNERDMLLFKGDASWKYQRTLAAMDKEIVKLEADYEAAQAASPVIETAPVFALTADNLAGSFPAAPKEGGEYRFCVNQKADAFLTVKISEFHGRVYASLGVYSLYTRSYQYRDSAIFSLEDIGPAMDELAGRLTMFAAGTAPAAIAVHAEPKDALVLINRTFAGRGETGAAERPPGTVEVSVAADEHSPASASLELVSGELMELFINLEPLAVTPFTISTREEVSGTRLYRGARYAGELPLTIEIPQGQAEYVSVEAADGRQGGAVIRGGLSGPVVTLTLSPPKEEKEVNRVRRGFYGAYGRFWIALPAAFFVSGLFTMYSSTYMLPESPGDAALYEQANTLYYVNLGTMIVAGGFLAESLIRMFRYIYVSGKHQPKTAK